MLKDELLIEMELVTGAGYTEETMIRADNRIFKMERLFNLGAGFTAKDATLPRRLLKGPLLDGEAQGQVVRLEEMLPEYYRIRGWDDNGVSTPSIPQARTRKHSVPLQRRPSKPCGTRDAHL